MSVDTTIPPRENRKLVLATLFLGAIALAVALVGLGHATTGPIAGSPQDSVAGSPQDSVAENPQDPIAGSPQDPVAESRQGFFRFMIVATGVLYAAAALLVFEPPPDNGFDLAVAEPYLAVARLFVLAFAVSGSYTILVSSSRVMASARTRWTYRRSGRPLVVLCGLGTLGRQILEDLRGGEVRDPPNVIVIEPDAARLGIATAVRLKALVLVGDPRDRDVRRQAMLDSATTVYIATGDDTKDIAIAADIIRDLRAAADREFRRKQGSRLECRVHVEDHGLVHALAEHGLSPAPGDPVRVRLFSLHDDAARMLLLDERIGLAANQVPGDDEVAHYFVFGFGAVGTSVVEQLARLAHFPNLRRPRITILDAFDSDDVVRAARNRFVAEYPAFSTWPDLAAHAANPDPEKDDWSWRAGAIDSDWAVNQAQAVEYATHAEFRELPGGTDSPALLALLKKRLVKQSPAVRPVLLVCFDDERRNVRSALRLRELLETLPVPELPAVVPTFVHVTANETGALLQGQDAHPRLPIHAFSHRGPAGSYQTTTQPLLDAIAERLHEAYDRARGTPTVEFEALPPLLRASNEEAAVHALIKVMSVGYRVIDAAGAEGGVLPREVRDRLARVEHNRWMAERLLAGWRYGAGEDWTELTRRRLRPALKPWRDLEEAEKQKDLEQVDELVAALHATGKRIVRRDSEVLQPSPSPSAGTTRKPSA